MGEQEARWSNGGTKVHKAGMAIQKLKGRGIQTQQSYMISLLLFVSK
jgi:hypothetical protein